MSGTPQADFVVHYLLYGFTLCWQSGTPDTWPADHRWVSRGHEHRVTCPGCKAELERRQDARKEG